MKNVVSWVPLADYFGLFRVGYHCPQVAKSVHLCLDSLDNVIRHSATNYYSVIQSCIYGFYVVNADLY